GERIEELSEVADGPAAAGQLTVDLVGQREGDEKRGRDLIVPGKTNEQERHEHRDGDQPADRECVRDVHLATEKFAENSRVGAHPSARDCGRRWFAGEDPRPGPCVIRYRGAPTAHRRREGSSRPHATSTPDSR